MTEFLHLVHKSPQAYTVCDLSMSAKLHHEPLEYVDKLIITMVDLDMEPMVDLIVPRASDEHIPFIQGSKVELNDSKNSSKRNRYIS